MGKIKDKERKEKRRKNIVVRGKWETLYIDLGASGGCDKQNVKERKLPKHSDYVSQRTLRSTGIRNSRCY